MIRPLFALSTKYLFIASLLGVCVSFTSAAAKSGKQIEDRIELLQGEINQLQADQSAALQRMLSDVYCSVCYYSKTTVERDLKVSFQDHLDRQGAQAVPPTQRMLDLARNEYQQKIDLRQHEIDSLLNQLEQEEIRKAKEEERRRAEEERAADRQRREEQAQRENEKRNRQDQAMQETTNRLSDDRAPLPSSSYDTSSSSSSTSSGRDVWLNPEQMRTQNRLAFDYALGNFINVFGHAIANSRRESNNAAAQAAAQAEAAAEAAEAARQARIAAALQKEGEQNESNWLNRMKNKFAGVLENLGLSKPASSFVAEVLGRTGKDLAVELGKQLKNSPELNLGEAAKGAINSELFGLNREILKAMQDRAYDQLPPDVRTQLREIDAVGSFFTFPNSERVVTKYELLCQKDIFEQIDKITPDM